MNVSQPLPCKEDSNVMTLYVLGITSVIFESQEFFTVGRVFIRTRQLDRQEKEEQSTQVHLVPPTHYSMEGSTYQR